MGREFKFGIPKIGCGLAGGSWNKVEKIVNNILIDEKVTCVLYEK